MNVYLRCPSRSSSLTDRVQPRWELPDAAVAPPAVPVRGCRARRRPLVLPEGGSQQGEGILHKSLLIYFLIFLWIFSCSDFGCSDPQDACNFSELLCFQEICGKDAVSGAREAGKQEEPQVHVSGVKIFYGSQTGTAKVNMG